MRKHPNVFFPKEVSRFRRYTGTIIFLELYQKVMSKMISSSLNLLSRLLVLLTARLFLIACGGGVTGNSKNYMVIKDQTVIDLNTVSISEVHVDQAVCVLIYENLTDVMPLKGEVVLAEITVLKDTTDLKLQLSRESKDGETMFAELHQGACDENSNVVITQEGSSSLHFVVTRSTVPYVEVKKFQLLDEKLIINKIVANKPTWVVVHLYGGESDKFGDVVGSVLVQAGHYDSYIHDKDKGKPVTVDSEKIEDRSVSIKIQISQQGKGSGVEDGDELIVALYENNAGIDKFDITKNSLINGAHSSIFTIKLVDDIGTL